MLTYIVSFGFLYLIGFALMAHAIKTSPEGFEDEHGFHNGSPSPKNDSKRFF